MQLGLVKYLELLLTAAIWGFAFVAQRKGSESLDPFLFNGLRFSLGALSILLLRWIWKQKEQTGRPEESVRLYAGRSFLNRFRPHLALGLLLFVAASLQQVGIIWTSAGSAGFITGLYVVFVPVIGLLRGQSLDRRMAIAVVVAVAGLYLINSGASLDATLGNALVLASAVFWALHVQMIDKLTRHHPSLDLALAQFSVCALLSLLSGFFYHLFLESGYLVSFDLLWNIQRALLPILYGGLMSVGIAYTLQIHAQKKVLPHQASLILCLEGAFAMLGGYLLLQERVSPTALVGALLLLTAMLISVLKRSVPAIRSF